jgi:hypothetical protein
MVQVQVQRREEERREKGRRREGGQLRVPLRLQLPLPPRSNVNAHFSAHLLFRTALCYPNLRFPFPFPLPLPLLTHRIASDRMMTRTGNRRPAVSKLLRLL